MIRSIKQAFPIVLAVLLLTACSSPEPDTHAGQPVARRVAAFKKMLQEMEQMGMVIRRRQEYKKAEFIEKARELQKLAQEPWQYFTADSNYPPTRAKPDIWEHPRNFAEFRKELDESLNQLVSAAESGNMEKIVPAYASVEDSCDACHKRFRKPLQ